MTPNNIDDEDLSRLIEIANRLSTEERKKLTLANIKATAQEMGMDISAEKLDKAFSILQEEKKLEILKETAQEKSKKTLLVGGFIAILLLISVTFYWVIAKRIPPFEGSVNVTLTSHIIETKAADILKSYKIFEQSSAVLLIEIQDIDKRNKIHYEIYDANNQLYLKENIKNTKTNTSDIYVKLPLTLPIGVSIGKWRIDIYIDQNKEQTHIFDVNWGNIDVTLTDALDNDSYMKAPIRKVGAFKKSELTYAICHVFWAILDKQRGGNTLVMKWINPNGILQEESKIALKPTNEKAYYWAKAGITLKNMPLGKWKMELWYADNKITEQEFTIEE